MAKKPRPVGRPTKYNEKLALRICELVATNTAGLHTLCADNDWMPADAQIKKWRWKYPEFRALYAQAKAAQAELLAEECIDIADYTLLDTITKTNKDGDDYEVANHEWINRSRLRVDTRKWFASKLAPKIYGDAKAVEDLTGQNDILRQELRTLRAELDAKSQKEF